MEEQSHMDYETHLRLRINELESLLEETNAHLAWAREDGMKYKNEVEVYKGACRKIVESVVHGTSLQVDEIVEGYVKKAREEYWEGYSPLAPLPQFGAMEQAKS